MKVKLCLFLLIVCLLTQNVYSSGALRYVLPYLSLIGASHLKMGEIAYDNTRDALAYKGANGINYLSNKDRTPISGFPLIGAHTTSINAFFALSAYVNPGTILIGNRTYKNTLSTRCLYSADH